MAITDFQVSGTNTKALFTLKLHRGEGMTLIAMNWKSGKPREDFVGFAIEYKEPGGIKFFPLKNRISFPHADGSTNPNKLSTLLSPIQKFRWVHFPRNAEMEGLFTYVVTPVFMNDLGELSYGDAQEAKIQLARVTYPGKLNVTFTRGFVSSQAFVDKYESKGPISTLLPAKADLGLKFAPTHPSTKEALAWMGFEARHAILEVLDKAIADKTAQVRVIAYDLSEPEIVNRLEQLGDRLKIVIDNSVEEKTGKGHGHSSSGESQAATRLRKSAGTKNVTRDHAGDLQHNKTIVVDGTKVKRVVCGSTNFAWRGFYVQANNAVVLEGANVVKLFAAAFDDYFKFDQTGFKKSTHAGWTKLGLTGIDASVTFSPHGSKNAVLASIGEDLDKHTTSSLFYSLAFLSITPGTIKEAITKLTASPTHFVYGMADSKVGGIVLQKPDGNPVPVFSTGLDENVPEPFRSEPTGGSGNRMHHKFLVIDFDKPTARVYLGSYNFSKAADNSNGENLLVIRDRRVAVAYMIEAIRIFDHYHFRVAQKEATTGVRKLQLRAAPTTSTGVPWWTEHYADARKIRDRELFA